MGLKYFVAVRGGSEKSLRQVIISNARLGSESAANVANRGFCELPGPTIAAHTIRVPNKRINDRTAVPSEGSVPDMISRSHVPPDHAEHTGDRMKETKDNYIGALNPFEGGKMTRNRLLHVKEEVLSSSTIST